MNNRKIIGVIGQGFVGGSLSTGMSHAFDVYTFDKKGVVAAGALRGARDEAGRDSLQTLISNLETKNLTDNFTGVYFVCLPTPMFEDGECDLRIVEQTLINMSIIPGERIAVVKSTVPPGTVEKWNKKFENSGLTVVFNPEFLTEKNALNDFKNQNRIIVGGPDHETKVVKQIFNTAFPNVPVIKTSSTNAEMVKYFTNIHLASRVVLSCEFWQLCNTLNHDGLDIDYDKVVEYAKYDPRLGGTHMNVPGADSIPGSRGHCLIEGSKITVKNNKKVKVENIKIGDELASTDHNLTNDGLKRVKHKNVRHYKGTVITIKAGSFSITCTPEHLIPINRLGKFLIIKAQDITATDEVFVYKSVKKKNLTL